MCDASLHEWVLETDDRDLTEVLASLLVDHRHTQIEKLCISTYSLVGYEPGLVP